MSNEIDQEIAKLKYNPDEILAFKGESIGSFKKAEGNSVGGKYIVTTREKISMTDTSADIGIIDSMLDLTFPGALILANTHLVENKPDPIMVQRKPIKFSIDLPGLESSESCFTVENPEYGNIRASIEEKFNFWNTKYSATHSINARSTCIESLVHSECQMLAKFGFGIKKASQSLNIDFKAIEENKSSVYVLALRQIFFTVSLNSMPTKPSDVFAEAVTWDDLKRFGVDDNNPPALVYKVGYGRSIFVKMETDYTSSDVEAALKAVIKGGDVSASANYKKILDSTTFTAVILGGGIDEQNEIIQSKDVSKIREIIAKYSTCNAMNPGYPISYSTCFLKDNKVASINNYAEYIKTTSQEYTNADIILQHDGGYVAQFKVEWQEVSYDANGDKTIVGKSWSGNLKDLTAPFSTTFTIPGNSENLCVFAKECTGLAWEWWRTIFDKKNIPLVKKRTFRIYGTTLNQHFTIDPDC